MTSESAAPRRPYTKTEQVQTTIRAEDLARLDSYADHCRVSRADAIRTFVLGGLHAYDVRLLEDETNAHLDGVATEHWK